MLHSGSNHNFIVGLWLALAILVLGSQSSLVLGYWQDPGVASGEQILVLKNGEMLIGRIEQDAGNLIVQVRQGSRLVISKNKAEFVCDSKSEAFWGKSARIRASDARKQVDLFRWCLKHKLFEHAESQLNIVMNSDVSATELDSLSRQLSVQRASHERQKQRELAEALRVKQLEVAEANRSQRLPESVQGQAVVGDLAASDSVASDFVANTRVDGMVQQASYADPVEQANRPARSQSKSSGGGFSKVAAIPDLKQSHRLGAVAPVVVDPYDAARFNAETVRRNGLK